MLEYAECHRGLPQVIIASLPLVAVAFFFSSLWCSESRVVFSFNFSKDSPLPRWYLRASTLTSIVYFMLIKGLEESTFAYKDWVNGHTLELIISCLIGFDHHAGPTLVRREYHSRSSSWRVHWPSRWPSLVMTS